MRTLTRTGLAAAALGLVATLAPIDAAGAATDTARPRTYEVVDLGLLPGAISSQANAINDHDVVVGWTDLGNAQSRAFRWEDGELTDLGALDPEGGSQANDVNDDGVIVGASSVPGGGYHPAMWRDGEIVDLGTLGGRFGHATGINEDGVVVGFSTTVTGDTHAFRWQDGTMTDLGTAPGATFSSAEGVDDAGRPVGESGGPVAWRHGAWRSLPLAPGADSGWALDVNDRGTHIVGYSLMPGGASPNRAVLWHRGRAIDLGLERGTSQAFGVNDRGQVVGYMTPVPMENDAAFLWERGRVTVLPALGGLEGGAASDVNNRGVVAGTSPDPTGVGSMGRAVIWRPAR